MKLKIIPIAILFLFFASFSAKAQKDDQCFACHDALEDQPSQLFKTDVHFNKGFSCAVCHGGDFTSDDMDIAMSTQKGFIGIPKGDKATEICASCHSNADKMKSYGSSLPTNQLENLASSVHGNLSTGGKTKIVQCITCHNVHGIKKVNDPASSVYSLNIPKTCSKCHSDPVFMRTYNPSLPVDQYAKYRTSVHGISNAKGDAKPADCADCHGSHEIRSAADVKSKVYPVNLPGTCSNCHSDKDYMKGYKIPTDQYEKYKLSVHGIALLKNNDPGAPACNDCHGNHSAAPPGVESISKVCGTCHTLNAELFSESVHKSAFDSKGFPECETCHGNHEIVTATNKLLGVTEEAVCYTCHEDANTDAYKAAYLMRKLIDSLDITRESAEKLIHEAEQKGMEISEAKFQLRGVKQVKLEARTQVHSFDVEKFKETVDGGLKLASDVNIEAQGAVNEYYFRRYGLGASVFVISLLAFGLFLYIRHIEKK